ncbi:MAG TPA: zf-HC2 domain-containing protein [Longimicrobiales bacterium]
MSNDGMLHLTPERLEAFAEGVLDDADRAVVESHLVMCARCQAEADEWKALFAALSSLPRIEPSPGFADRVMAGVHVRQPWAARVMDLLRRLVPTGMTGWLLATALLALPVLATGGVLMWLLSRPTITPAGLWLFVRERTTDGLLSLAGRAGSAVLESSTAHWLWESAQRLVIGVGAAQLGAAAAMFAMMTALALWILYENLFRTSTRERYHVMHCI